MAWPIAAPMTKPASAGTITLDPSERFMLWQ
jgi:hypothetical protein